MWDWSPSKERQVRQEERQNTIISHLFHDLRQKLEASLEKGALNWATTFIKAKGSILLKTGIPGCYTPSVRLSVHDEMQDVSTQMMQEFFHDVTVLSILLPLNCKYMTYHTANSSHEARVEFTARGLKTRAQRTLFDIRVFEPAASCHWAWHQRQIINEMIKKRKKGPTPERIQNTNHGVFIKLVSFYKFRKE